MTIGGQYEFLEEHIAQKKVVYDRYKEGLKDFPIQMNPFDEKRCVPNYWLKEYRNKAGLSQNSLAEMMNTSRNTIINWETDKSRPDIDNIRELCLLLGIPLSELFNIPSTEQPSVKEKTMLSQFRKLSTVSQRIITRMVNSISKSINYIKTQAEAE